MICNTCGSTVYENRNAEDWSWPFACSFCDAERLPDHLKHYTKRPGYVAPVAPTGFLKRLKWVLSGKS